MSAKYIFIALLFSTINLSAAMSTLKNVEMNIAGDKNIISLVGLNKGYETPELKIIDQGVEVILPNTMVNSKMAKNLGSYQVIANKYDRSTVKVFIKNNSNEKVKLEGIVSLNLKDESVELVLPKLKTVKMNSLVDKKNETIEFSEKLDEAYLAKLESEETKNDKVKNVEVNKDEVVLSTSAVEKDHIPNNNSSIDSRSNGKEDVSESKGNFSIFPYVVKFAAFLGVIVLGFYAVLTLFKKGVIKKSSLGFLNSTKLVEVLNTTHLAPKRSLMMIKAHRQVFLISSTENGIQLISEISDVTGLIKTGEREISGTNFDSNLDDAQVGSVSFNLKNESLQNTTSLDNYLSASDEDFEGGVDTYAINAMKNKPIKDNVKFSDQIKSKVKNLKPLV